MVGLHPFPGLLVHLRGVRAQQLISDSFAMRQAIHAPRVTSSLSGLHKVDASSLASNEELEIPIDEILQRIRYEFEHTNDNNQ